MVPSEVLLKFVNIVFFHRANHFVKNHHLAVTVAFDCNPHVGKRLESSQCVFTLEETGHPGGALCQGAQHDRAVRHGFVAGDAGLAGNGTAGHQSEFHYVSLTSCCAAALPE